MISNFEPKKAKRKQSSDSDKSGGSKKSDKKPKIMTESDEERALGGVHGKMLKVCNFVSNHEEAWVFYGHVTEEMAPGYSKIIRRPMCLKAIEDKIKDSFQTGF